MNGFNNNTQTKRLKEFFLFHEFGTKLLFRLKLRVVGAIVIFFYDFHFGLGFSTTMEFLRGAFVVAYRANKPPYQPIPASCIVDT